MLEAASPVLTCRLAEIGDGNPGMNSIPLDICDLAHAAMSALQSSIGVEKPGQQPPDWVTKMIEQSVGRGGVNNRNDTLIVQCSLNVWRSRNQIPWIEIDGIVGPETTGAISHFQSRYALGHDCRVDPGGPIITKLRSLLG